MTVNEIIALDFRKEENKKKIQKALRKIKPFEKIGIEEDVPIEKLEKFMFLVCKKYSVRVQYMFFPCFSKDSEVLMYSLSIKRDDTHEWITSIHTISVYEAFAKVCIALYYITKKKMVPERE